MQLYIHSTKLTFGRHLRPQNDLLCVKWYVKLYSLWTSKVLHILYTRGKDW